MYWHFQASFQAFEIDEYVVEKHNTDWFLIYNSLFNNNETLNKVNEELKYVTPKMFNRNIQLYVPLRFFFTKQSQSAFPIAALYRSDVNIRLQTNNITDVFMGNKIISSVTFNKAVLSVNYIHLDKKEQKYFANNTHEYLIEQTQILSEINITSTTKTKKIPLDFAHPIKSFYWVIVNDINNSQNMKTGNNWLSYTSSDSLYSDTFNTAKITINGQDRLIDLDASYFRNVVPYEIQSYFPRKYIYSYSFSLYPGQYQPSGSCNYSRIQNNNSFLELSFNNVNTYGGSTNGRVKTYGINYNILKISEGQGGLLFMN